MIAITAQESDTGFAAFISYAHVDGRWAQWAHRALETYRLPRSVAVVRGQRRVGRVFLDRSELATSTSLSDRIGEALIGSSNLVVICSPAARASRWVNEEVRRFRAMGRGNRIFCLIVAGDPARDDEQGCFPPALLETTADGPRLEPLAADVRPGNDKPADARLKIIAGLLDLPYDALRQREAARRQRVLAIVAGISLTLFAVMAVLTTFALLARIEAERQRAEAIKQRDKQQRTSTFLQDVFDQARPDRAGQDVTLLSAVDDAATRALRSSELAHEPEVKASLLHVLADVYVKMSRISDARRLNRIAIALSIEDPQTRIMLLSQEASLQIWESDFGGLRRTLTRAFALLASRSDLEEYRPALLAYRAQLARKDGDTDAAVRDWDEMRRLSLAASPPDRDNALLSLLAQGVAAVDDGQPDRGAPLLRRVVATREAMGQPIHPDVLTATNTLGAVEIKRGHPVEAERWFRRAERLQRQVYGDASLDVALTRSNLGRSLVEQRRLAEAIQVLQAARAAFVAQAGDKVDTLANLEDSLGLAQGGLGNAMAARAAFDHGLAVARANEMPKEIELLTDRGELECRTSNAALGLSLVGQARAALARFDLPEPWRGARIDAVEATCLLASGEATKARPLLVRAKPLVTARWGAASLFGRRVADDERRARLD